jgi:hypothetical protein
MKKIKSRFTVLFAIVASLTIACSAFFRIPQSSPGSNEMDIGRDGESSANGERIYFTATNEEGERIPYRSGPNFGGMMMGSYLTCAACHGPEARGGTHLMHMQVMEAPDIRYEALSEEGDEHGSEGGDEHADAHEEYTLEDFRMAVVEGKHPDGEQLNRDMPRWGINDEDLVDLFEFLKSLP